ncbi:MAG: HlyD family efflux transporter periplasmic adaptor subunit [Rivihabitans pingtungensis]
MARPSRPLLIALLLSLAMLAAAGLYWRAQRGKLPEGLVQANGRIEGDHVLVSGKFAGKLARVLVREGDSVSAGQVLAELDDSQIRAKVAQAEASVAALQAQLKVAEQQVPLAVASARAARERAAAASAQAARDAERFDALLERGSVDRRRSEQMRLAATAAATQLTQAEQQVREAELGPDRVAALRAQLGQAEAALAEARAVRGLTLRAQPGVVVSKLKQAGETVAAGAPVFDLVDLDRLYLKAYIPENLIGKVRLGQPGAPVCGRLPRHRLCRPGGHHHRTEFTPKRVQTADERVKLVYAVRLNLSDNRERKLSPGLPADAVIQLGQRRRLAKSRAGEPGNERTASVDCRARRLVKRYGATLAVNALDLSRLARSELFGLIGPDGAST